MYRIYNILLYSIHSSIKFLGFDSNSVRELCLRDIRNFQREVYKVSFDAAVGILIPLLEKENDLLLLGKKGDNIIQQIGLEPNALSYYSKYVGKCSIPHAFNRDSIY